MNPGGDKTFNLTSPVFLRHTVGDTKVPFCLQSCVKPLKYAVAVNDHSTEFVHSFIGKEPSGLRFNKLFLNEEGETFDCGGESGKSEEGWSRSQDPWRRPNFSLAQRCSVCRE